VEYTVVTLLFDKIREYKMYVHICRDEESETFYDEHYFRKQELRELKLLQKQEQKQFQVRILLFCHLIMTKGESGVAVHVLAVITLPSSFASSIFNKFQ
jgi:hypothetical protein